MNRYNRTRTISNNIELAVWLAIIGMLVSEIIKPTKFCSNALLVLFWVNIVFNSFSIVPRTKTFVSHKTPMANLMVITLGYLGGIVYSIYVDWLWTAGFLILALFTFWSYEVSIRRLEE